MEAVAQALSQAERNKHASQAARETTGDVREDARMMRGQTGHIEGDAKILLNAVLEQATGIDPETPADNKRRKGKAPANEESTRTPEAVK